MSRIDAIVLAGAPVDPEMSQAEGLGSRAMIPLGGKSMLQWVVDALRGSECVGRVAAVGSVNADGLDQVIEPGDSLVSNMRRGIEALGDADRVLVVSSDIPLLTPEAVQDFVEKSSRLDADLAYPIHTQPCCESRFPGFRRTYLTTADGVFTGGNMMLVRPDFVFRNWDIIADAYSARKQVLKLARMIGMGVLLRVLAARLFPGALRISMLEDAASRMLQAKVRAVVSDYPEIGEDVDKQSDLDAVRELLASAGGRQ